MDCFGVSSCLCILRVGFVFGAFDLDTSNLGGGLEILFLDGKCYTWFFRCV